MTNTPTDILNESQLSPLQKLRQFLAYLEYDTEMISKSPEIHFETLLVGLDEGVVESHTHVAQLFFSEDVLNLPETQSIQDALNQMATLQIMVDLPLHWHEAKPETLLKGYAFMQTCNRILPVGHLGLTAKKELYYRYGLRSEDQNLSIPLIVDLLTLIGYFLSKMTPLLKRVANESLENLERNLERAIAGADV